jgi:hypothetical protein
MAHELSGGSKSIFATGAPIRVFFFLSTGSKRILFTALSERISPGHPIFRRHRKRSFKESVKGGTRSRNEAIRKVG